MKSFTIELLKSNFFLPITQLCTMKSENKGYYGHNMITYPSQLYLEKMEDISIQPRNSWSSRMHFLSGLQAADPTEKSHPL